MFRYLASPYSDPSEIVRELRYRAVESAVVARLHEGVHVYSPIVHCHPLAVRYDLPKDAKFWMEYNKAMIRLAWEFEVLRLPGWEESVGIKSEIAFVDSLKITHPLYSDPAEDEVIEALRKLA